MNMKETLEKLADEIQENGNTPTYNHKTMYSFKKGVHVTCPAKEPICDTFTDIILDGDRLLLFNKRCYGRIIPKEKWNQIAIIKEP